MSRTVGILCGSVRDGGNGAAITRWLKATLDQLPSAAPNDITFRILDSSNAPLPLGPVLDTKISQMVRKSEDYAYDGTRRWSELVYGLSGLVIVSPQYNWGYPGPLKDTLDHLYHEWTSLPLVIVTYGGHGGGKAGAQLRQVCEGGFHFDLVSQGEVEITLPREFIAGGERVGGGEEWLRAYEGKVGEVGVRLVDAVKGFRREAGRGKGGGH